MSVEKVDGLDVIKADETVLENVFYDKESGIVMVSENENELSPTTGSQMENIGFVEKTDNEKVTMIKFLVDSAKGINTSKINKEVQPMTQNTEAVAEVIETEAAVEVIKSEVAPEVDAIVETPTEEVAKSEETPAVDVVEETIEVSKSDETTVNPVEEIKNTLESAFSDLVSKVNSLQAEVEMLKSSKVDVETAKQSFEAVAKDIATATNTFNEFGKRVELVEQDTAFRKSGDLGEIVQNQPETVEKSLWGGSFLKTADLFI